MKKAPAIIAATLTAVVLLGTLSFYFIKNISGSPMYIHSLTPSAESEVQTDQIRTDSDSLVNINTANADQLAKLPGIGNVIAQRIIDYRNEHGLFQSPADLLNVPGIGEAKLESILDLITTGGST